MNPNICLICGENIWNLIGSHQEFLKSRICICDHCGFITTIPLPAKEKIQEHYNKIYRSEERKIPLIYRASQERRAKSQFLFMKSSLPSNLDGYRVLEIGAGIGTLAQKFKKNGSIITGFEPRKELAEYANQHYQIKLYNKEYDPHTVMDRSWDLIIVSHVLEHIADLQDFLNSLKKLIRNNGYLFIEVPNDNRVKISNRIQFKKKTDSHLHFFSTNTLKTLLSSCGFKIVSMLTVGVNTKEIILRSGPSAQKNLSSLEIQIQKIHSRAKNHHGALRFGLHVLRKVFSGILFIKKISLLYFRNPNFSYYHPDSNIQGNWIRALAQPEIDS
jgi:2-polyprenyl-3-methyl-5-hydroxy-6-metoxy-1,4-benzoquinol methylase